MNSFREKRTNPSGFTLVELLIVVGLVGLLASIASMEYKHLVAQARRTEGRLALSGIYTALHTYAIEAGSYTGCLTQAGYVPEGSVRFYATGFSAQRISTFGNICGPGGDQPCNVYDYTGGVPCANST